MIHVSDVHPVFVISPIGEEGSRTRERSDKVLRHIVRKALPESEFRVLRADEDDSADSITPIVIRRIFESQLCVADLSEQNPNVFYELAVAHGYHRPVVHLCQKGDHIPFDLQDQRTIFYDISDPDSIEDAVTRLGTQARGALVNPDAQHNPMSGAERFYSLNPGGHAAEASAPLIEALEELTLRVRSLQGGIDSRLEVLEDAIRKYLLGAPEPGSVKTQEAWVAGIHRLEESIVGFNERLDRLEIVRDSSRGQGRPSAPPRDAVPEHNVSSSKSLLTGVPSGARGSSDRPPRMDEFLERSRKLISATGSWLHVEAEDDTRAVVIGDMGPMPKRVRGELKALADNLGVSLRVRSR